MPGPLISRRDIATGAVSFTKRRFTNPTGKAKQARVFFSWASAAETVSMPHGLGVKPTSFTVVNSGLSTGAGAPTVYVADPVFWASKNVVALASSTANSWAEVLVQ